MDGENAETEHLGMITGQHHQEVLPKYRLLVDREKKLRLEAPLVELV